MDTVLLDQTEPGSYQSLSEAEERCVCGSLLPARGWCECGRRSEPSPEALLEVAMRLSFIPPTKDLFRDD
ncbi:MAG: hypothetical protein KGI45_01815 [Patescibacteria group bacterium]|nr:hypothetical protein [Patescibacteria group bacterium]MDE1940654.1 hypothetical protein [Patescibacteria group bacterium]MDE1966792.1 hypothetical protein [Patescibacteria group bacterium]